MIALAAPVCRVCDFCLIFVPFGHYDELEILSYAIPLICSIGADVKQNVELHFFGNSVDSRGPFLTETPSSMIDMSRDKF